MSALYSGTFCLLFLWCSHTFSVHYSVFSFCDAVLIPAASLFPSVSVPIHSFCSFLWKCLCQWRNSVCGIGCKCVEKISKQCGSEVRKPEENLTQPKCSGWLWEKRSLCFNLMKLKRSCGQSIYSIWHPVPCCLHIDVSLSCSEGRLADAADVFYSVTLFSVLISENVWPGLGWLLCAEAV